MKENGLTEAQCREDGDDMPGDVKARVILKGDMNHDRHTIISQVTLFACKSVAISARVSHHAHLSIVDIRGHKDDVANATRIWSELYRLIKGEWHTIQQACASDCALKGFPKVDEWNIADEFSWLTGLLQGYCVQEQRQAEWAAIIEKRQEALKIKDAPKQKRKKFKPAKFNPMAVICVPKKPVMPPTEPEPVEHFKGVETPLDAAHYPADDQPEGAKKLDEFSWRLGYRFGTHLFERMPAIQKNGKI